MPGQAEFLEQRPTWSAGKPRAITTTLPLLSAADARRMAGHLLGSAPNPVVDRVCDAAEGNPLYLEQLTATLEDQGLLADGRWLGTEDATVEIPTTLQALLAARLDRLEPTSRLVLERASVEGRRFRIAALRALAPDVTPEGFAAGIEMLDRRGLIQPEDEAAGSWRFAHALVMEAAYRGLSKELRADLHERLADWMTDEDAERPMSTSRSPVISSASSTCGRSRSTRRALGRSCRKCRWALRERRLPGVHGNGYISARDFLSGPRHCSRGFSSPHADPPEPGSRPRRLGPRGGSDALLGRPSNSPRCGLERDAVRASVQILSNRIYRRRPMRRSHRHSRSTARVRDFEAASDEVGRPRRRSSSTTSRSTCACEVAQRWATSAMFHALAAGRHGSDAGPAI